MTDARTAGRTFHHLDFEAADLAARKRELGRTVSVVVPARNEQAMVGHVAGTLRGTLVDGTGLVDELLVVDGDSSDDTAAEAAAAGARVLAQSAILPEAGSALGKGEALWKGLAATSGDLVVFVDADIEDIGPRFVVGLLGPLLTDDTVRFVKAAYERPLRVGGEVHPTGGGRVTELMARPLLSAFWPELAWLAQPLSGEYAGDRDLLESLPFVRGYGVELGLLVDIADRVGAEVIAQVDLGRRLHHNQALTDLGPMAAEILQVALERLASTGRLVLTDPPSSLLLQPGPAAEGFPAGARPIEVSQRPPLTQWREQH